MKTFDEVREGSESWEAGFKRRVVKTTKPEHKEKGFKWRIKDKDRPEISIKLYKNKPDFVIMVFGETPYAEGFGDIKNLNFWLKCNCERTDMLHGREQWEPITKTHLNIIIDRPNG